MPIVKIKLFGNNKLYLYIYPHKFCGFFSSIIQGSTSEHPIIFEAGTRTKTVPIKEKRFHRRVSDSIANNYSLKAKNLSTSAICRLKIKQISGKLSIHSIFNTK